MKDVTTTSFGLVIAYMLPGLVALYSMTFWSSSIKNILNTFLAAKADLGLSIMILAAATVVGLLVNALRFLIFERVLCRTKRLRADRFSKLTDNQKLMVFTTLLEENFRYQQFYGSMTLLLPVLYAGYLKHLNSYIARDCWFIFLAIFFTLILASLAFLLYEIKEASAGLKEFLWRFDRIKTQLIKGGTRLAKVALWIMLAWVLLLDLLWLFLYQNVSNRGLVILFTFGFSILEIATAAAAIVALRLYRERTLNVLSAETV